VSRVCPQCVFGAIRVADREHTQRGWDPLGLGLFIRLFGCDVDLWSGSGVDCSAVVSRLMSGAEVGCSAGFSAGVATSLIVVLCHTPSPSPSPPAL
jgi:hypothetical protein